MKSILCLLVVTMTTHIHGKALNHNDDDMRRTAAYELCKKECKTKLDFCLEGCDRDDSDQDCRPECGREYDGCTGEQRTSDDTAAVGNFRREVENPESCKKFEILNHQAKQEAQRRELGYYF